MFVRLFLAAVAALFVFATSVVASPSYGHIDRVTGQLILPNGDLCSATVYRNALITSKHCVEDQPVEVRFRGINMRVEGYRFRGENAMILVDASLGPSARLARPPKPGARLYIVGNPMGLKQVYRQVTLAQVQDGELLIDCRCWKGDSGAGVFDEGGRLVGIFYGAYLDQHWIGAIQYTFPYAYPLNFTKADYADARQ